MKTFNHLVPRLGATYDLTGDGKTVLKANWGRFYFNPGVNLADAVNPNTSDQYVDYNWNDLNGDRVFQNGEQGVRSRARGGTADAAIDAEPGELLHRRSVVLRRARGARRPRRARRLRVEEGQRRLAAGQRGAAATRTTTIPVTIVDPGPDGVATTTARQRPEPQPVEPGRHQRGRPTR